MTSGGTRHDGRLERAIAEYLAADPPPEREAFLARHPDLAGELQEFFAGRDGTLPAGAPENGGEKRGQVQSRAPSVGTGQSPPPETGPVPFSPSAGEPEATFVSGKGGGDTTPTIVPGTLPGAPVPGGRERVGYFGDYELVEEIARGGMGVVYKARQANLGRIVALKMILAGQLASQKDVQRFHQEAEAAANLEHPGIVPIYEVGEYEGQHYFSMAYVDGPTLSEVVADGPLPPAEAAEVVWKLAEAIEYAHQKGVVHRDLKPANVLLAHVEGEAGQRNSQVVSLSGSAERPDRAGAYLPKITDFGLAKRTEGDADLTGTGQILGTPGYMPPEQAAGRIEAIGPPADIYSLGAILYCLLTGRPPFQSASVMDTLLQVIEKDPISPRELNPQVPRDLETICLECLRKDRLKRYESAGALADELRRFSNGEPILARPVGRLERGWRWCRRNPVVATLTSLVAVLLVVGTVTASTLAVRSARNAERARENAAEAERHATAAEKLAVEKGSLAEEKSALFELEQEARHTAERLAGEKTELAALESAAKARAMLARADAEVSAARMRMAQDETTKLLYVARVNLAQRALDENNVGRVLQLLDATRPEQTGGIDLRGFEWFHLWNLCHADRMTIDTGDWLRDVAASPDGRWLASAGRSVRLYDAETGEPLRELPHPSFVSAVAVSPDGTLVASACNDEIVRTWNAATGELVHEFEGHGQPVLAIAFDATGTRLASAAGFKGTTEPGAGFGEIALWDVEAGELLRRLPDQDYAVFAVRFDPRGMFVATGDRRGILRLWDPEDGREVHRWRAGSTAIMALDISPDGQLLVCGGWAGTRLKVFALPGGEELLDLADHDGDVRSVRFHPDGRRIISGGKDQNVAVWDASTGELLKKFRGHSDAVVGLALRPRAGTIISAGMQEGRLKFWDLDGTAGSSMLRYSTIRGVDAGNLAVSGNDRRLAVVKGYDWDPDSHVEVWDPADPTTLVSRSFETKPDAIAIDPEGRRLATADDGIVTLWEADTLEPLYVFPAGESPIGALEFDPTGRLLATGDESGVIVVWDTTTHEPAFELRTDGAERVGGLAFSPNGEWLAAADFLGLKVWDTNTREVLLVQDFRSNRKQVAFAHDGSFLVCSHGKSVRFYRPGPWRRTRILEAHRQNVAGLSLSPDDRRLATCSDDLTVKLWDVATLEETFARAVDRPEIVYCVAFDETGRRLFLAGGGTAGVRVLHAERPEFDTALEPLARWAGHEGAIRGLDYSPDGRLAVSASGWPSGDATARLWDVETGRVLQVFEGHGAHVQTVRFLPDGKRVLTGSLDTTLRLWDVETGAEIRRFEGHAGGIERLAVFPDGRRAAAASPDGTVRVWDLATGEPLGLFDDFPMRVMAVAVTPDGEHLLAASANEIFLCNVADEAIVRRFVGHVREIEHVAISSDGTHAASAGKDRTIVWDMETGNPLSELSSGDAYHVAFTPDGRTVLTAGGDGTLRIWDVETGNELNRIVAHPDRLWAVAVSPNGETILTGGGGRDPANLSDDHDVRLWPFPERDDRDANQPRPETYGPIHPVAWWHGHTGAIRSIDVSPDGTLAATSSGWPAPDETIRVWETATGRTVRVLEGHVGDVQSVKFLPDGERLVSCGADGTIRVWSVEIGVEPVVLVKQPAKLHRVVVFPDGKRLATAGLDDLSARIWDLETGEELGRQSFPIRVVGLAVAPDGSSLLVGAGTRIGLWTLEDDRVDRYFDGHEANVEFITFAPDGRSFASSSYIDAIVWNLETGEPLHRLPSGRVNMLAYTPDGRRLVTAGGDHTIRLWDVASGEELHRLTGHRDTVWAIALSPDGEWLYSGGGQRGTNAELEAPFDNIVRQWRMPRPGTEATQ